MNITDQLAQALEGLIAVCNYEDIRPHVTVYITSGKRALEAYRASKEGEKGMWDCPECERLRSEEFCHSCGNKRTDFYPVPSRPIRAT